METDHRVVVGDSRDLAGVPDDSVELVVTSPPYPMVEMWDDLFVDLEPAIGECIDAGDGQGAFELMHGQLDAVWEQLERVLVDGGIACINVGDATRTVGDSFRVYQNHSRVVDAFEALGFDPLPEVLWRKPANSAAKFMGSGMLPPNAYVTLEHEYILIFRNGPGRRRFQPGSERRYSAAFFWEERNRWFSDLWTDITGELQALDDDGLQANDLQTLDDDGPQSFESDGSQALKGDRPQSFEGDGSQALDDGTQAIEDDELRDRSGAYPFEIPYRLINMYSVYGDTVLDPFWGTGTTSLAAMVAARNSIGYELDKAFTRVFHDRVADVRGISRQVVGTRLDDHRAFVAQRRDAGESFTYEAEHYAFPVTTKQERTLKFYVVEAIEATNSGYRASHRPVEGEEL